MARRISRDIFDESDFPISQVRRNILSRTGADIEENEQKPLIAVASSATDLTPGTCTWPAWRQESRTAMAEEGLTSCRPLAEARRIERTPVPILNDAAIARESYRLTMPVKPFKP